MKTVLTRTKDTYVANHPCVSNLNFSFGSSAELAAQIVNGSPADVFIAASESTKNQVVTAGLAVGEPVRIARNKMAILMYAQSPFVGAVQKLSDLQDVVHPDIKVGVCVSTAPCGAILPALLESDELTVADIADTEAASVADLVTKVQLGELDAGIVFGSDCATARTNKTAVCVDIVQDIPNPVTTPIYAVALNAQPNTSSWMANISSAATKSLLQKSYGFLAP